MMRCVRANRITERRYASVMERREGGGDWMSEGRRREWSSLGGLNACEMNTNRSHYSFARS